MRITRVLQQLLNERLQEYKPAIINNIQNYTASLSNAVTEGHSKASIAAHVMLEVDETMQQRVPWQLIQCTKGCAFCCNVSVAITEGEAELIINFCKLHSIDINREVLSIQATLSPQERPLHELSRCVFLSKDNTCKIYEVRPLNCRKHLSLSDADLCNCRKHTSASVAIHFDANTEILVSAYNSLNMKEGSMAEILLEKLEPLGNEAVR